MPERPLRTSTLACGWEMAWAAHPAGLGGAGDHVSTRILDLLLHLPLCPVCTAPPPRGLFSLSFLKCLLCPSVHPALFFYRVPSHSRAVLHVGSGSSANTAGQRLGPCGSRGRVLGSEPESLAPLSPGGSPSSRASISLPADDLRADLSSARNPPVVLQECVGLGGSGTLPRAWQAPSPWEGKDSHHVQPPGRRGPG